MRQYKIDTSGEWRDPERGERSEAENPIDGASWALVPHCEAADVDRKQVALELRGKSPLIRFVDADIKSAVDGAVSGIFLSNGQTCDAESRLTDVTPAGRALRQGCGTTR